ncbi:MAG: heme-binding protein [Alphaproteobacteria bacterium]|nr:heme-binding protein [Alphaproteobacteria bacterium]
MSDTAKHLRLTYDGAMKMMHAAVEKAQEMGKPQCIAIVDDGGNLLAFVRMDGAKILSIDSSIRKALTAASNRVPTGGVPTEIEYRLAHVTSGRLVNLKAGLPIIVDGITIGGIGVGSQTGEEDLEVAKAGLAVLSAAEQF